MRLSQKLLLFVTIITTTTSVITAGFNYVITKNSLLSNLNEQQTQYAKQVMEKVDRFLNDKIGTLEQLSKSPTISKTIDLPTEPNLETSNEILKNAQTSSEPWMSLIVANTDGDIIASTGTKETTILNNEAYQIAIKTTLSGRSYYSDVYQTPQNTTTLIIAKPIRSITHQNKPIIGLIIGHIFWEEVQEIILKDSKATGPLLSLFNKSGQIIATHSELEPIFIATESFNRNTDEEYLLVKEKGLAKLTSIVSESGFSNFKGNNWTLVAQTPESSYTPTLNKQIWYASSFLILLLISFGLLSITINKIFIINPLEKLRQLIIHNNPGGTLSTNDKHSNEFENLQKDLLTMLKNIKIADKSKSEFISIASHQLRTPPSAIKWALELLKETTPESNLKQHKLIDNIAEENQKMINLITSLLNHTRLELGTFKITPEPTNINSFVKQTLNSLSEQIQNKKITLKTNFDKSLKESNLDKNLFDIIIKNVLVNAIIYNHPGGQMDVSTTKNKDSFTVKIKDTGIGIPKNSQSSIYKKLFRAENAKSMNTEGTGLGLYIAKTILDYCNGSINFESTENQGTSFYVTLPLSGMSLKPGNTTIKSN